MNLAKVFFWGMLVSFLGSLPLGTLNVVAMQISIQRSVMAAIYFSCGSLLTEMLYVRVSLVGINWIRKQKTLFKWLEWATLLIVVALAIGTFISAAHGHGTSKNVLVNNNVHPFLLGLGMSAISPMQIPFWFGWSTVLFTKGVLKPDNAHYNLYIVGIGLGTLMGNCVFIFGGPLIASKLNANQHIIDWVIGGIFSLTAVIQLFKIIYHKDAAEKLDKLGEALPEPEHTHK